MSIGKYVTNPGVIGAAAGALSTARRTQSMRKDWRRLLVWGVWLAGFALAVATVAMQEQDEEYDIEHEAEKRERKRRKKQR
ncbi:hypothetical protein H490_0113040 [Leucobacter sp. UCD-THU]|uniref:Uncharacterized protein n=1 Tax=Leucobacter muris TaxID=1935379 RepID=A0ABX5QE75_9MICO|nr:MULTISPECIES: hypothetical protein [Leucobacter]EYT52249.1 hypothetical protein H490_0113040 [Leucobacter sp. UCD-THU]QAB17372.1 hypothetical protein Leucomu_05065 [Leucobacter muris]